jgi:chloramphenicol O-acetyltransferase type A
VGEDVFSFCTIDYVEDFPEFAAIAAKGIEDVKDHLTLEDDPDRDDLLFMTSIPWVSFTSFRAPMPSHPGDSIPRYAWGKLIQDGETLKMPLCVEVHHALIDGAHVGKFYTQAQDFLRQPEVMLGEA